MFKSWSHIDILVRKVQNVLIVKTIQYSQLAIATNLSIRMSVHLCISFKDFFNARYIPYSLLWLGGTVDTIGHEVLPNGKLKEIDTSSGGPWGGKLVNDAFGEFIAELVITTLWHKSFVSFLLACALFTFT